MTVPELSPPQRAKRQHKAKRPYSKHGLARQKAAFNKRGVHALDGRTKAARELLRWRAGLVADLGGEEAISTQQQAVVDLAVRTKLLLDSVDNWLLQQPSLVKKRKKASSSLRSCGAGVEPNPPNRMSFQRP